MANISMQGRTDYSMTSDVMASLDLAGAPPIGGSLNMDDEQHLAPANINDCKSADIESTIGAIGNHNTKQDTEHDMIPGENLDEPFLVHKTEGSKASQQPVTHHTHKECFLWKPVKLLRRRHGLALALLSPVFFSIQSVCLDVLTETIDSFQVVLMHVPIMVLCCFVFLLWARIGPPSFQNYKNYLWLLASGSCQTFNTCVFTLVLSFLTVGDAVTIVYTALIQVGFFSWLILKEPMRLFDLLFALLAFMGVIFIARPPFIFGSDVDHPISKVNLLGIAYALAASCTGALLFVFNRKLSMLGVHSFFCLFFNSFMVFFTSCIICLVLNRWHCPTMHEWLYALVAGAAYFFGNVVLFYSLKAEKATLVTVIFTMEIVLAFFWQIVLLNMLPPWTSYIGASLVVAACIGITLKNKPSHAEEEITDEDHEAAVNV